MLRREHFPTNEYHGSEPSGEFFENHEFSDHEESMSTEEQFAFRDEYNLDSYIGLTAREEFDADEDEGEAAFPGVPSAGVTAKLTSHPLLHAFLTGLAITISGLIVITTGAVGIPKEDLHPTKPAPTEVQPGTETEPESPSETEPAGTVPVTTEEETETATVSESETEVPTESESESGSETETEVESGSESESETETEPPTQAPTATSTAPPTESVHTHVLTAHGANEASCTAAGNTAYWVCDGCGKYFSDAEGRNETSQAATVVAAKGHTAGGEVQENVREADCTTEGGYELVSRCTSCGAELSRRTVTTPALGHTITYHEAVSATCTTTGTQAYYQCGRCGGYFLDEAGTRQIMGPTVITALGHEFPLGVWNDESPTVCIRNCGTPALTVSYDEAGHEFHYTINSDFYDALTAAGCDAQLTVVTSDDNHLELGALQEMWTPSAGASGTIVMYEGYAGTFTCHLRMIYIYNSARYSAISPSISISVMF